MKRHTRRDVLKALGAGTSAALTRPLLGQAAAPLTVAGRTVDMTIGPAGAMTVRFTLAPPGQAVPDDGSLVRRIAVPRPAGDIVLTPLVNPDAVTLVVRRGGEDVQRLRVDLAPRPRRDAIHAHAPDRGAHQS